MFIFRTPPSISYVHNKNLTELKLWDTILIKRKMNPPDERQRVNILRNSFRIWVQDFVRLRWYRNLVKSGVALRSVSSRTCARTVTGSAYRGVDLTIVSVSSSSQSPRLRPKDGPIWVTTYSRSFFYFYFYLKIYYSLNIDIVVWKSPRFQTFTIGFRTWIR